MLKSGIRSKPDLSLRPRAVSVIALLALLSQIPFGPIAWASERDLTSQDMKKVLVVDSDLEFKIQDAADQNPKIVIKGYFHSSLRNRIGFKLLSLNEKNEVKIVPFLKDDSGFKDLNAEPMAETTKESTHEITLRAYKNKNHPVRILYGSEGEEVASFIPAKFAEAKKQELAKIQNELRETVDCLNCDASLKQDRLADLQRQLAEISNVVVDPKEKAALLKKLADAREKAKKDAEKSAQENEKAELLADVEALSQDLADASLRNLSSLRAKASDLKARLQALRLEKAEKKDIENKLFEALSNIATQYAEAGDIKEVRKTVAELKAFGRADDVKKLEHDLSDSIRQRQYADLQQEAILSVQNGSAPLFFMKVQNELSKAQAAQAQACARGASSEECREATAHVAALQNISGIPQKILMGQLQGGMQTNGLGGAPSGFPGQMPGQSPGGASGMFPMLTNPYNGYQALPNTSGPATQPSLPPHMMFPSTANPFQNPNALVNPLGMNSMPSFMSMGSIGTPQTTPFAMGLLPEFPR